MAAVGVVDAVDAVDVDVDDELTMVAADASRRKSVDRRWFIMIIIFRSWKPEG